MKILKCELYDLCRKNHWHKYNSCLQLFNNESKDGGLL